ncbi:phage scaffolding protein [Paenibacillus lautus]|uniref:phage scaffolding protein n=1 Tax=Paenibacillus lautus TaxID=1401 RepID=UPI001C7D8B74|nr:phage scaffolding protein [Paenibacillus lautus]MBX4145959.1 phage scaffolding protein [Paenibacillus lautus]
MDLKELLGEELYNQVIAKAGDKHKIAVVSDGAWIPKDKFNEANEAKKKLETDLRDRDKQLADLKDAAKGNEELQAQIKKLQDDNKATKEKYDADMKDLQLNTALKLALGSDVHDADYAISQLDKSKIEIGEDGSIKAGLEDQVKSLRESKAFLFAEESENTGLTLKGAKPAEGGKGGGEDNPIAAEISSIFSQR